MILLFLRENFEFNKSFVIFFVLYHILFYEYRSHEYIDDIINVHDAEMKYHIEIKKSNILII